MYQMIKNETRKPKAVVLLSGGMDSTACAAYLVSCFGKENVIALSIGYGQKHDNEMLHASAVAEHLGIEFHEVSLQPIIFSGGDSALLKADGVDVPELTYEEIQTRQGVSPTYVPFRNGNLLSVATALALTLDADYVCYGAHAEDAANHAYPDCTPEFIGAMSNAIHQGTYFKVRLLTPLINMSKSDVVAFGNKYNAPFKLTLSCYKGHKPSCGVCPTCVSRIEAFKQQGLIDPIKYEIQINWGGCK